MTKLGLAAIAAVFGAMLLLSGCSSPLSGEYATGKSKTMTVSKEVWGGFQEYVGKISGVNKGIFVVGVLDGEAVTAVYYYCPATKCVVENAAKEAMDECRGQGSGYNFGPRWECILFAQSGRILVNYKVAEK
jgi:hypothetical protein